jgi:hypothetical protein
MRFALVMVVVLAGACEDEQDAPDKAQRVAECRRLEDHIIRITPRPGANDPETDPQRIAELMAKIPIEDIEQCAAIKDPDAAKKDPAAAAKGIAAIACIQAASSAAAIRACIPAKTE